VHKETRYMLRERSRTLTCAQFYKLRSATSWTRLGSVAVSLRPDAVLAHKTYDEGGTNGEWTWRKAHQSWCGARKLFQAQESDEIIPDSG
jgi:hypothetical protein